jgi:hypothetical protein
MPAATHNGNVFELPGGKGFFEVGSAGTGAKSRGARATGSTNTISVFFYEPDGTTPLSPVPTEVAVKVGTTADSRTVALRPQSQGGFTSDPGQYPSGFRGILSAKIDGEAVEATFLIR